MPDDTGSGERSQPCCVVPAAPTSLTNDTCWLTSARIAVPTLLCAVFEPTGTSARGVTDSSLLEVTPIVSATTPGVLLDCGGRELASS